MLFAGDKYTVCRRQVHCLQEANIMYVGGKNAICRRQILHLQEASTLSAGSKLSAGGKHYVLIYNQGMSQVSDSL